MRTLLAVMLVCSMPAWTVVQAVKVNRLVEEAAKHGLHINPGPDPDGPVVCVATVLALTGVLINKWSKSRKPVAVFLLAVPVPIVLGLLGAWYELNELVSSYGGPYFSPSDLALTQDAAWARVRFGLVASLPVLLIGIGGLIWPKAPIDAVDACSEEDAKPFQYSLATLFIVTTVFAVILSASSFTDRPAWTASMLTVIAASLLIAANAWEGGCGLGVILLCLWFGGIWALRDPWGPALLVALLLFAIVRGVTNSRRCPSVVPPN